jgi:hypothetical protein
MELSRLVRHHAVRDSLCARDPSSVSKNREIERDRDAIATRARATRVQPRATRRVMFFYAPSSFRAIPCANTGFGRVGECGPRIS